MSRKAEKTSRYSSQQSWWQFLIRHPLLLKVVTWLSSLSILANTSVSWAEVKPVKVISQSAVPSVFQSKPLPIVTPIQPVLVQSGVEIKANHRKLHNDLLTAENFIVAVQGASPALIRSPQSNVLVAPTAINCQTQTSQLVSGICSQVRPQNKKAANNAAVKPRIMPAVAPLPVVNNQPPLAKLVSNKPVTSARLQTVEPKPAIQYAKPQPLAPLYIPGAISIYVAPPRTNVIPVEPLSKIPTVSKLAVPNLAPLPVVKAPVAQSLVGRDLPAGAAQLNPASTDSVGNYANYQVAAGLIYPLASPAPMTSRFGWRVHPITGNRRFHAGVDLGAPMGAPVVAAATGRVVIANWHGGYGKAIVIEHNGKLQTLYGHLSEIFVQEGQEIRQGMVIGRVGSTGASTGPHLHFETHAATSDGWVAVDPGPDVKYALDNMRQAAQYSRRDLVPGS